MRVLRILHFFTILLIILLHNRVLRGVEKKPTKVLTGTY